MLASTTIAMAAALFAGLSTAAPTARQSATKYNVQVVTDDGGVPVTSLAAACHAGAAIEALCVYPNTSSEFTFTGNPGYLVFDEPENGNQAQELSFISEGNDTSNVQPAYFGGSTNPPVELRLDETYSQLGVVVSPTETQYVWYVCPYSNLGYTYNTVTWVKDFETPTDSECQKVLLKLIEV